MALQEHFNTLKTRHEDLGQRIEHEEQRPLPDQMELAIMKKKKLLLKEEMSRFSG